MLNFLSISQNLKSHSIQEGLKLYEQYFYKLNNGDELKSDLTSMNIFMYTYFLLEYKKDLENLANKYRFLIEKEANKDKLFDLGKSMLKAYSLSLSEEISTNYNSLVNETLKYINKNFSYRITLQEIADKLYVSKNHLCQLFKEKTGYSFCQYLALRRVEYAKILLKENKKNLDFIAYKCGFSSHSHFSTIFKKYTGMTPNEYRKCYL